MTARDAREDVDDTFDARAALALRRSGFTFATGLRIPNKES